MTTASRRDRHSLQLGVDGKTRDSRGRGFSRLPNSTASARCQEVFSSVKTHGPVQEHAPTGNAAYRRPQSKRAGLAGCQPALGFPPGGVPFTTDPLAEGLIVIKRNSSWRSPQ